ncbi:MAG TPA: N(4)-(beta-N-acetylglucosaminyl)-L-asparaginase [Bacteroidia bacterium]|jgi:N4-(beta-N-acetylglucosaminyl)-L-asparaginase|nr:N(4)-(beta-N-acetylglucosaminyl)-L-asparaginase [Bacteroidia bacterium]
MTSRREFIKKSALASAFVIGGMPKINNAKEPVKSTSRKPIVISTWSFGIAANDAAWKVLSANGRALDAVEAGVKVPEADPTVSSVGLGGLPDRDGYVTLDAAIMDENGNGGSVAFLQHIVHPISVARMVMEKTPHVMLVGDGALQFALDNGFKKEELLTPESKAAWEKWKKENNYNQKIDKNNHDTIGMVAIDASGNLSGACTTSGLAWKMHGRVGDSPILGDGMFVDNEVGAACSTGKGEAVMKICGSAIIVEMMRNGKTPQEACEAAVKRIAAKQKDYNDFQVGFLALNRNGDVGAYAMQKGFQYALAVDGENKLYDSDYLNK